LVWDIVTILFILIWLNELLGKTHWSILHWISSDKKIIIFHLTVGIYILFFFLKGKVRERLLRAKEEMKGPQINNDYYKDSELYVENDPIIYKE
jgi:hypothetical protein